MKNINIKSGYDGIDLNLTIYEVEKPKAIVQIIHGMKEHQKRYENFALTLNSNGYTVVTSDLRGHGHNTTLLGYMEGEKPWIGLVADQVSISNYIRENYPNNKVFLFAHSMGTIIARNLIQENANRYDKIILSGVPAYQKATKLGLLVADIIGFFKSNTYVSNLLENLTLKPFIKSVKDRQSDVDWISVNQDNINNYVNDPYCDIPFTVSAYKSLYHLVNNMHKSRKYQVSDANKPILMLVGELDPCPLGKKGLADSVKTLNRAGYQNVSTKTYPNMRHEILNETENDLVFNDVIKFFND